MVDTGAMSHLGYPTALSYRLDRLQLASHQLLSLGGTEVDDAPFAALRGQISARIRATRGGLPLVAELGERLGLSQSEVEVFWLLAAVELEPDVRAQVAQLGLIELTAELVRRAVYGNQSGRALAELGADGRLQRLGLVHWPANQADLPPSRRAVRPTDRALALALGHDEVDGMPWRLALVEASHEGTAAGDLAVALAGCALILVTGSSVDASSVAAAMGGTGRGLLVLDARSLSEDGEQVRQAVRTLQREAALAGRIPMVEAIDALCGAARAIVIAEFDGYTDAVVATCTTTATVLGPATRPVVRLELPRVRGDAAASLWERSLGAAAVAAVAAERYALPAAHIARVAAAARAAAGGGTPTAAQVHEAVRGLLEPGLAGVASRVEVTQTWDDFVLPMEQMEVLAELVARVRGRRRVLEEWGFGAKVGKGGGVAALMSGPPGTGKTMAAGLLAKELGLDLYQVDLSKIVSKYIGETEKQLAAVFDAAEAGHAVLLFDEADSLFGKRTEVKSSNDRYANLETNYLLQRLEAFTGVCLLTTNHEQAIDEAFRRRLALHVRLPMPDEAQRAALWQAMLPARAAVAGPIDAGELARRFVMSGGYIKNAVLRAAYLAADEGGAISMALLRRAGQAEQEAMGRVVAA